MNINNSIFALSFDCLSSPRIFPQMLEGSEGNVSEISQAWGICWYPNDEDAAALIKDVIVIDTPIRSTTFLCFMERLQYNYNVMDMQPIVKPYAGLDWIWSSFKHLPLRKEGYDQKNKLLYAFKPVGMTLSELLFCSFLEYLNTRAIIKLSQMMANQFEEFINSIRLISDESFIVSDGTSFFIYQGTNLDSQLYFKRLLLPAAYDLYSVQNIYLDISNPLDYNRTMMVVSSSPKNLEGWTPIKQNHLLVISKAQQVKYEEVRIPTITSNVSAVTPTIPQGENIVFLDQQFTVGQPEPELHYGSPVAPPVPSKTQKTSQKYKITHETIYNYENSVEYSSHVLRLQPNFLRDQHVLRYNLDLSVTTESISFEDVFGNQTARFVVKENYKELKIFSHSEVEVFPRLTEDFGHPLRQVTIPLFWMPWQRQMMLPYLLPPELPTSQLEELSDYALSFVVRNSYNLLDTILNINDTIWHDYKYLSNTTTLQTTPYEVYINRFGVCQDFANLFICLARLLNIPARYRVGYIYTGVEEVNTVQSEATHAWLELYLPFVGWRGFDPTNGIMVDQDHILVACGRNYLDATPTEGTIYKGGGKEKLQIRVTVNKF